MNTKNENARTAIAEKGTAVITGASAGLGKIYANRLAQQGYDLLLVARRNEKLEEIRDELVKKYGRVVETLAADLSKSSDLEKVVAAIAYNINITMLVNNAGTSTLAYVAATSLPDLQAMNALNIDALSQLSRVAITAFKERDKGVLINIGSVLGLETLPISSIYSGTKAYVNSFTRGLQKEVEGTNVRVQLVLPSATATDIWEISGVPLSNLNQDSIMSPGDCVDAALKGLELGEDSTFPSVDDIQLIANYENARLALFHGSQNGKPATRYKAK